MLAFVKVEAEEIAFGIEHLLDKMGVQKILDHGGTT
jgi:hypothetical protein